MGHVIIGLLPIECCFSILFYLYFMVLEFSFPVRTLPVRFWAASVGTRAEVPAPSETFLHGICGENITRSWKTDERLLLLF